MTGFRPVDFLKLAITPEIIDQVIKRVTLADATYEFLLDLKMGNRSKATDLYYRKIFKGFSQMPLPKYIHEIATSHIKEYLAQKQHSIYSMHGSYRGLRAFFNWAMDQKYCIENPVLAIKAPKLPNKIIPAVEIDEVRLLLAQCDDSFMGLRNGALIRFLFDTGVRLSECSNITLSDLDIEHCICRIYGKGNKQRFIAFSKKTAKVVWQYLKLHNRKHNSLWLTEEYKPLKAGGIVEICRRLCKQAGLRRISPHKFRHGFAVNCLRNGMDIFSLQQLLGHESIDMVRRYSKTLNQDDALRAHEKFSPGDRL